MSRESYYILEQWAKSDRGWLVLSPPLDLAHECEQTTPEQLSRDMAEMEAEGE